MKKNILLLNYNNYFNRVVKREYSLEEYNNYIVGSPLNNVNFNPNDGLSTAITVNVPSSDEKPNYVLVTNQDGSFDSRWFIMEAIRLRRNQYSLVLKRDLLVDYQNKYMIEPAYIEKGHVSKDNPLIFNKEGLAFNQIKKNEEPLYDTTGCGWIVGYLDNKYPEEEINIDGQTTQIVVKSLSSLPYYSQFIGKDDKVITDKEILCSGPLDEIKSNIQFNVTGNYQGDSYDRISITKSLGNSAIGKSGITTEVNQLGSTSISYANNIRTSLIQSNHLKNVAENFINTVTINTDQIIPLGNTHTKEDFNLLIKSFNQVFQGPDGKFYKLTGQYNSDVHDVRLRDISRQDGFSSPNEVINATAFNSVMDSITEFNTVNYTTPTQPGSGHELLCNFYCNGYNVTLTETTDPSKTYKINIKPSINKLHDAPYKIFCIPYGSKIKINNDVFDMNKDFAMNIATSIMYKAQTFCYDIQLLPYSPINEWFNQKGDINVLDNEYNTLDNNYSLIYRNDEINTKIGAIFHPVKSSFTTNIPLNIEVNNLTDEEFKIRRETDIYRLCSPNYANFQDFDPFMNYGVNLINVDCTYKPLTPYIKLNINYKGLYGNDFNDSRGLVCGGDFSLPVMSDQWQRYQIDNKNYSNIFERQTENLETQRNINLTKTAIGTVGIVGSAAVTGAIKIGPKIPYPNTSYQRYTEHGYEILGYEDYKADVKARLDRAKGFAGTVTGAAPAAAAIGINSIIDNTWGHSEAMDLRKDMYNFNLQNIQARPQGLVKTSAFNYNSRIVPFLEYYTATNVEKDGLRRKIKYNGMTVNMIGTVSEYLNNGDETFIKGSLIRLSDDSDDLNLITEISNELKLGAYFK